MFEAKNFNPASSVTPFWQFPEGMYLIKQPSSYPLIEHYGVLVTGGLIPRLGINSSVPIVIQQTYPSARIDWAEATGRWNMVGKVDHWMIPSAIERVSIAFSNPNYDLFANNCEQFARFISVGQKTSTQLWAVGLGAAFVFALCLLSHDGD